METKVWRKQTVKNLTTGWPGIRTRCEHGKPPSTIKMAPPALAVSPFSLPRRTFGLTDSPFANFTILPPNGFAILPPVSISAPVCFNILLFPCVPIGFTILPVYHLSIVSFTILPFASIFGPAGFTISPISLRPCRFYHFTNFPGIRRLVVLVSLVSLFSLAMLAIPATIPRQVFLGSLPGTVILAMVVFLSNLVSLRIHFVIDCRRKYPKGRCLPSAPGQFICRLAVSQSAGFAAIWPTI